MTEPVWVHIDALLALHGRSLALHGGAPGIRDRGLLESAMQKPANLHAYAGVDDLAVLASAYAVGISSNHPFVDGNKRAAFQALLLFLRLNGAKLRADPVDATRAMLAVAAGEWDLDALAEWVRPRLA